MQEGDAENCCSICFEILDPSKKIIITEKIMDLLKLLVTRINFILQETAICETCLEKIQTACKFKILCSENLYSTSKTFHKNNICPLCKNVGKDCFSVYDSLDEIKKMDLMNYLTAGLEVKTIIGNSNMCEECYKFMLNFCSITNLLSIFDLDKISTLTTENKRNRKNQCVQSKTGFPHVNVIKTNHVDIVEGKSVQNMKVTNEHLKDESRIEEFDKPISDFSGEILHHSLFGSLWNSQQALDSPTSMMFKCDYCEYQTQLKKNLKSHMMTHRNPNEIRIFKCPFCEHISKRKGNLKDHMLIHKNPEEIEMFKCMECTYQSKYHKGLKRHMLIHMNSGEVAMFECENCQFRTRHKSYMLKHVLIHQKIPLYKCPKCDFQTKQNRYLVSHLLIHKEPNEVTMYKCQSCEYQTKRRSDLRRHNSRIHRTTQV